MMRRRKTWREIRAQRWRTKGKMSRGTTLKGSSQKGDERTGIKSFVFLSSSVRSSSLLGEPSM